MPDPKRYLEDWSAITPTDFGLQAAYWSGKPEEPVTFRPILGWITYNAKEIGSSPDTLLKNGFGAVVLSDAWWPLLAFQINDYGGVFPKTLDLETVKAKIAEWRSSGAEQFRINVREVGQA